MSSLVYKKVGLADGELLIYAGLHYIRGNTSPYFSLTGHAHPYGSGAIHDLILEHCPELAPLADLHLSDVHGVSLHAEENGWYWLEGAAGGWGSQFQGSNDKSSGTTPKKCLKILAKHLRLPNAEAQALLESMGTLVKTRGVIAAKQGFAWYVERLKPHWKAEADEAIELFNLRIYGDFWPGFQAAT